MTRDQRFWRLLTLLEDYYTTGERSAGDPPAVRFPRPRPPRPPGAAPAPAAASAPVPKPAPPAGRADAAAAGRPRALGGAAPRPATPAAEPPRAPGSAPPRVPAGRAAPDAAPPARSAAAGAGEQVTGAAAGDSLPQVAAEVAACRACGLCAGRTNGVPGEGAARPLVMVVGEGPGREEDRSGRPFVGAAGQYLDRWLAAIDLQRDANCFITNVVKCRPPGNRDPLPEEANACRPFLQRQIRLLRPQALLSVGRIASQALIGRQAPIGALRGQVHHYPADQAGAAPLPLVATYHPSAVLRNPSLRRPVWDDLRLLQRLLAPAGEAG